MKLTWSRSPDNRLSRWWRHSILRALLEGSFFLGWLISDNRVLAEKPDYMAGSWCYRTGDRLLSWLFAPCYRLGRGVKGWISGSTLLTRPLAWLGALLILLAVLVYAIHPGINGLFMALALVLAGIGLLTVRNGRKLAEGSLLIGLLAWWWINTD